MATHGNGAETVIVSGAARSGTAVVAAAIAAAEDCVAVDVGPTLGLISVVAAAEQGYRRDLDAVRPGAGRPEAPQAAAAELVLRTLLGEAPGRRVLRAADVLPEVPCLRALPRLASHLPEARFVHVRRGAVDFVASRRRAMPTVQFLAHCLVWSEAEKAWQGVAPALGGRAIEVSHEALLANPSAVGQDLGGRFGWSARARERFLTAIRTESIGKTSLSRAPLDLVGSGWSLAEKMAFADICGPGMQALGQPLDIAGAIRRRPLRLDEAIAGGEALFQGTDGEIRRDGAPQGIEIVWPETAGNGLLVLPGVAINGRKRLKLTAGSIHANAPPTGLRVDILESINRRSCVSVERPIAAERVAISATLNSTANLVDVIFSAHPAAAGKRFGFKLFEATLSGEETA